LKKDVAAFDERDIIVFVMKNITTVTVSITNSELASLRKMLTKSINETDKLSIDDNLSATQRAEYRTATSTNLAAISEIDRVINNW
jgi:hypothetical protein